MKHKCAKYCIYVLVLTEIELIFFLLGSIMLCFGFGKTIMLITHWCFTCC